MSLGMPIKNISVIGAGTMGHGIAQVAAMSGYNVTLVDVDNSVLAAALAKIEANLQKGVEIGKVSAQTMRSALEQIAVSVDLAGAGASADLVIEAVLEDMALKKSVFTQLDESTPVHAILATNTSTMSPSEIGSVTRRPQQVIAMHFFNPVHLMKLVEIVRSLDTSDETVGKAVEVSRCMGKEAVVLHESPGFITSRISAMVGNEAFHMLQEGVASAEDIDLALKLGLNYPMGPLRLADLVGLDVRLRNLEYLQKFYGDKFRPCPLLVKYVKAGRLGVKSGRGVYDYTGR